MIFQTPLGPTALIVVASFSGGGVPMKDLEKRHRSWLVKNLRKLGKREVDALKAPVAGLLDVFDTELRGFHVRVFASGRKSYRLKYSIAGRSRVATIGEHGAPMPYGPLTAERARKEAERLRGYVNARIDPLVAQREAALASGRALLLKDLIEKYLEEGPVAKPHKRASSWRHDASRLRHHIIPLLGHLQADRVRRADIEDAQHKITNGATKSDRKTRKRGRAIVRGGRTIAGGALTSLSACYNWARERELAAANPVEHVRKEKAQPHERFLSGEEVATLLDTLNAMEREGALANVFADALRVLLLTGARKQEICDLRWAEVDFEQRLIRLPRHRSKTGEKLILLVPAALQLLAARRPGEVRQGEQLLEEYVFPSMVNKAKPAVGLQKAWARVRERAKLTDVRIHDLRHTFASFAAASGASLPLIAKALGHRQTSTTERYAHLGVDPVREMVDRVGIAVLAAGRVRDEEVRIVPLDRNLRRKGPE